MRIFLLFAVFCCAFLFSRSQTESSLSLGRKQYQEENYAEALKMFDKARTEEPNNADIPFLVAHVYSDMSDYKKAAFWFEKAIAMDSSRSNWIYECGLIYYAIPDYKKSLQYIELAGARGYKRTSDYLENLANAYVNTKQYAKAIDIYKEVSLKKPADQAILYQLAQACFQDRRYDDAIGYWDKILSLDKSNAESLYMIGLSYQWKGEKEKGQQLCDKAIQMDPSLASKKKTMGGSL